MATLLTMCTEVMNELGSIETPDYLFTNTNDTAKQLIAIAKRVGRELVRLHPWQELIQTATVTTVADTDNYALESDYDRAVPITNWDSTENKRVYHVGAVEYAEIVNAPIVPGITHYYRIKGNRVYVKPTPDSVWSFNYEYISKNYCESSGGTDQSEWAADSDVPLLDEELFIAGIRFYFYRDNGLDYANAEAEYDAIIRARSEYNVPSGAINMAARVTHPATDLMPNYLNIPDQAITT